MLAEGPQGLSLPGQGRLVPPSWLAVSEGLVGYWEVIPAALDFANSKILDLSRNNNLGTLNSLTGANYIDNGRIGGSLTISTTSTFIDVGTAANLNPANELTLAAWVNQSALPGANTTQIIIGRDSNTANTRSYDLYVTNNAGVIGYGLNIFMNDSSGSIKTGATTPIINAWYFVACTYKFVTNGTSIITVYVNGQFDGQATNAVGPLQQTANRTILGKRDYSGFNDPLIGRLGSCRIYNRCLDPGEIAQLYALGWQGKNMADTRRELPAIIAVAPSFIPAWAQQTNIPVLGTGVY